jgi:ABC-2 type transport system permease protein
MQALWAVYQREVTLYFKSFIGYGIAVALMLFVGFYQLILFDFIVTAQASNGSSGYAAADLASQLVGVFVFLLFLISPLLTMRLLSEESREGTLELLMTLPMGEWVFVVGKFLAAWTFYTFLLGLTLVHVLMFSQLGPINPGVFFSAYLGAWLYGGATMAICLIWSAITEDQLVAAFLGAAVILMLFLAENIGGLGGDNWFLTQVANALRELAITSHFQSTMIEGVMRAQDVTYFVLVIIVSLFLATLIVGTRRWRAS